MNSKLGETPTRKEAIEYISESSMYGNLGLFVGAGFSKAVMNNGFDQIALSWDQLLEKASSKLDVDYEEIWKEGVGYPDVASSICVKYSEDNDCTYNEALSKLKRQIALLTSWYPDKENREKYSNYLHNLDAEWIVTTNYDLIIESLLTGRSIPLGPDESLTSPKDQVPVYHLHGVRTNPEGIIIAQEDYVSLFRPNEYRQIKLALTIKESTTLLLGYGLGDVNVLTAIDWSKNVFVNKQENYPHDVIQIYRTKNPKDEPYRDRNGILIIETSDLTKFFDEYSDIHKALKEEKEKQDVSLRDLSSRLESPDEDLINKFIDDEKFRMELLKILSTFSKNLISGFVSFLNSCIDETWVRAEPNGAFQAYDQGLTVILDILTTLKFKQIPPALLETCAYALQRVGYYVGDGYGESWQANRTFERRKGELSKELVDELKNIAEQHWYTNLIKLMRRINA
ncbi:SIR2 family NAD-dependent protein deacylase [Shewanella chilikensis]|uniref:SIR2 family NAD-dependent protein deacylase n=1 Tax=Shewanella chilikensis TaxID=558541 RepID=UPI003A969D09